MKNIDKNVLTEMYNNKKTLKEIAEFFGCAIPTVSYHVKKLGLSRKKVIEENNVQEEPVKEESISREVKIANYLEKLILRRICQKRNIVF